MEILKAKATLKNLDLFLSFVEKFAKEKGINATLSSELVLVAEEILVNVVNYAYPPAGSGDMEIKLSIDKKVLSFCLIDEGIPFDMNLADDPDLTLTVDEKEIGGMGIYLVKHIMDEIRYERKDNKNILILTKCCK